MCSKPLDSLFAKAIVAVLVIAVLWLSEAVFQIERDVRLLKAYNEEVWRVISVERNPAVENKKAD